MEKEIKVELITDVDRLNWLEKQQGCGLISDDFGHWAVSSNGMQNIPENPPNDVDTWFFIEKDEWQPSIREAIDFAYAKYQREQDDEDK